MEDSLEESIKKVFAMPSAPGGDETPSPGLTTPLSRDGKIHSLIMQVNQHFMEARRLQREENWAGYGEEMKKVQSAIDALMSLYGAEKERPKKDEKDTGKKGETPEK